jgi:hypothetical protein
MFPVVDVLEWRPSLKGFLVSREMVGMAGILNQIFKDAKERADGRIDFFRGFWRLVGSKEGTVSEDEPRFERLDALNRPMEMVGGPSVKCLHPKWEPTCAKTGKGYWVLSKHCKRCEFYRTAKQSRRKYPCCQYEAKGGNSSIEGLKAVNEALANASQFADAIMGKKPDKNGETP